MINEKFALELYLKEIGRTKLLSESREAELAYAAMAGDKSARNKLVEGNLRFVVSVAKRFARLGYDLDELIQEGNIGLINAAEKYDPSKGYKFTTYAVWQIRAAIDKVMFGQSDLIRLPKSQKELFMKTKNQIDSLDAMFENCDGEESSFYDFQVDDKVINPEEECIFRADIDAVLECVDKLKPAEKLVFTRRLGLGDEEPASFAEISQEMECTRENVRQIQIKAVKNIRQMLVREYDYEFAA